MLRGLRDALLNVITLGEHEHPGGLREYGSQTLHSLDPRTPEGLASLAAMFVPGPGGRGGRFEGAFTKNQLDFLNQLHNVEPFRTHLGTEYGYRQRSRQRPAQDFWPFSQKHVEAKPGLMEIANQLGYARPIHPLWENRAHVDPKILFETRPGPNPGPSRADMELGVGLGGQRGSHADIPPEPMNPTVQSLMKILLWNHGYGRNPN